MNIYISIKFFWNIYTFNIDKTLVLSIQNDIILLLYKQQKSNITINDSKKNQKFRFETFYI